MFMFSVIFLFSSFLKFYQDPEFGYTDRQFDLAEWDEVLLAEQIALLDRFDINFK